MSYATKGFVIGNMGSGGSSSKGIFVGIVSKNGSFPTTRLDGTALQDEDYVKPNASDCPFTIGTVTFTTAKDRALYLKGTWYLEAGALQDTSETPVDDKTTESLSGTSTTQNNVNKENVLELKKVIQSISIDAANKKIVFNKQDTTKFELDLADVAGETNTNPVMSKVVWQQILKSSECKFELDTTDSTKDKLHIKLVNNNGTTVYDGYVNFNDIIVLQNKTQTIKNKTVDADDNTIQNLTGANLKSQTAADDGKTWIWDHTNSQWKLDYAGKIDSVSAKTGETVISVDNTDTKNPKLESKISTTQGTGVSVTKVSDGLKVEVQDGTTTQKGIVQLSSTPSSSEETKSITPKGANITITKQATADTGYIATYVLSQGGVDLATKINIPMDYLVKSASVKTCTTQDVPIAGLNVGDKYIDFVVNVKEGTATDDHIYIACKDIASEYTNGNGIEISSSNVISVKSDNSTIETTATGIKVKDGGITVGKIADDAVETAKIKNDNVTYEKLDSDISITTATEVLDDPSITNKFITPRALYQFAHPDGTTIERDDTNGLQIKDEGVTTSKIKDKNVTIDKIADTNISTAITETPVDTKLPTEKAVGDLVGKLSTLATTIKTSIVNAINELVNKFNDYLSLSGGTMTGAIAMSNNKITGLATPTDNNDAVNKSYADTKQNAILSGTTEPTSAQGQNGDVYILYTA